MHHNPSGSILEAQIAYLDEFPRANGIVKTSLMQALNERTFSRGTQFLSLPLATVIATGNQIDTENSLEAVNSRFAGWAVCPKLTAHDLDGVCRDGGKPFEPEMKYKITKAELLLINSIVKDQHPEIKINCEPHIAAAMIRLAHGYLDKAKQDFIKQNSRRTTMATSLAKASALLCGRNKIDFSDFYAMRFALTVIGEHKNAKENTEEFDRSCKTIRDMYSKESNKQIFTILAELDQGLDTLFEHVIQEKAINISRFQKFITVIGLKDPRKLVFSELITGLKSINLANASNELSEEVRIKHQALILKLNSFMTRMSIDQAHNILMTS